LQAYTVMLLKKSTGRLEEVLKTLEKEGLAEKTLVIFTSDNGPWLPFKTHGGSAGLLRDMRVPAVMWWPKHLKQGVVTEMGSTLDLFPTIINLAGGKIPEDRILDGYDLYPVLFGTGQGPRNEMYFYQGAQLYAVRVGNYKAHFKTKTAYTDQLEPEIHEPPLLFNLGHDPAEKFDIAAENPAIIEIIREKTKLHSESVIPVEDQLIKLIEN